VWCVVDTGAVVQKMMSNFDFNQLPNNVLTVELPSNMQILHHHPNNGTVQVRFYYYAGQHEKKTQVVPLQGAAAELGLSSRRLHSCSGSDLFAVQRGISELILGSDTQRQEINLLACSVALEMATNAAAMSAESHLEDTATPVNRPTVFKGALSPGQRLEKLLGCLDDDSLEEIQAVLESSRKLGFHTLEQLSAIIELYRNSTPKKTQND